jgi:hypothetical protein
MREDLTCLLCFCLSLLVLTAACQPVPVDAGVFWQGRGDSGLSPDSARGSGGAATGLGGSGSGGANPRAGSPVGGATGSGGAVGSGGGVGSGGATGLGGATGPAVLTGSLAVSVTTRAAGGEYAPDNVGAIWIADGGTTFVKSLYVWGQQRRRELTRWTAATSAAGLSNNLVDAVTAATMSSHGARMATWNGTNASRTLVPDGSYKVCFELADGSTQYQCVDFMKSRTAQSLMPADTTSFTRRSIVYTP